MLQVKFWSMNVGKKIKIHSVPKHHDLIQIYYPHSGTNEHKIMNYIIFSVLNGQVEKNVCYTSHKEIKDFLKFDINHKQLITNLTNMDKTKVEFGLLNEGNHIWNIDTLIDYTDDEDRENSIISITLSEELVNMITNYKDSYCRLNFALENTFQSGYTIRLYENLKKFTNRKKNFRFFPEISIDMFKKLMGIESDKYRRIAHLKEKVIDPATKDVNDFTDISVDYEIRTKIVNKEKKHFIKFDISFRRKNSSVIESAFFHNNKRLVIFVDEYLYKFADGQTIGFIENHPVIYQKQNRQLVMQSQYGETFLDYHTSLVVLTECFENKKQFEWYKSEEFVKILQKNKDKDKSEKFKG